MARRADRGGPHDVRPLTAPRGYPHPEDAGWQAGRSAPPRRIIHVTGNAPSPDHEREVDTAMDEITAAPVAE
ncbi:MAG: hypothetical protein QG587_2003, partial [Chloroflexota bacterium]|nr:hypothetical protein [Chloroflexota bacterium]